MKKIVIVLIALGLVFYFFIRNTLPESIYFLGGEYKLAEDTGINGMMKTYRYTKSGRVSNFDDYVQVLVIEKSAKLDAPIEKSKQGIKDAYSLKPVSSLDGEFGVFTPAGAQRNYFAYMIERETPSAYWFVFFIIQSNFDENKISSSEAKENISKYVLSLDTVFSDMSH